MNMDDKKKHKKHSTPRRIIRGSLFIVLGSLLFIFTLIGLMILLLQLPSVASWVRTLALDAVHPTIPGLHVRELKGNFINEIILEDIQLNDRFGNKTLEVQRLRLRYNLRSLIQQNIHIEQLEILQPDISLRKTSTGRLNFQELITPQPTPSEPSKNGFKNWRLQVEQLKITQGTLDNQLTSASTLPALSNIEVLLQADIHSARMAVGIKNLAFLAEDLQVDFLDNVEQAVTRINGHIELTPQRVDGTLHLKMHGLFPHLAAKASSKHPQQPALDLAISTSGPFHAVSFDAQLKAAGHPIFRLDGSADVRSFSTLNYQITSQLTKVNPKIFKASLPEGNLNLLLQIHGTGTPLAKSSQITIEARSSGSSLHEFQMKHLRLKGHLRGQDWRLQDLQLQTNLANLSALGTGTLQKFRLTFDLKNDRLQNLYRIDDRLNLRGNISLAGTVEGGFSGPMPLS
jgi:uncharacterized protein involved in outer membrane biogenesis